MPKSEKKIFLNFSSLKPHSLYDVISPAISILEQEYDNQLRHSANEYLSQNLIKVIAESNSYTIISGISPYLKLYKKVGKINVLLVTDSKCSIEASIAADILTSDLHLWHPQAQIIHAGVLSYFQTHPSIASKVEEITCLKITPINNFLKSSSLIKRSVYYELKQKHYAVNCSPQEQEAIYTEQKPEINFTGTIPMKLLVDGGKNGLLHLYFDKEKQLIYAEIDDGETITFITDQVSINENSQYAIYTISLNKTVIVETHFIEHLDFILGNNRLVLMLKNNQISGGRLFTESTSFFVRHTNEGEIKIVKTEEIIGTITYCDKTYIFQPSEAYKPVTSPIKNVLIKPNNKVQP